MTTSKAPRKDRPAAAAHRNPRARAEECLDNALRRSRIAVQTTENGWRHFSYRNVEGYAFVEREDRELVFTVLVEVMALPSDGALVIPLMRELLEGNAHVPGPARFAILRDRVIATTVAPVDSLAEEDYAGCVKSAAMAGRVVGGWLPRKYGVTTRKRPPHRPRMSGVANGSS